VQSSVPNPNGPGTFYSFIQSKLNSKNVITADGNSVKASEKKSPDSQDQLWEFSDAFVYSNDGLSYNYIQSAKDGNAITIPDGTKNSNTLLQMSALNNGPNQQWFFQGGVGAKPGVRSSP